MTDAARPSAVDIMGVSSRVSWGAIVAGAMVALTIYVLLSVLGVALGIEVAVRGASDQLGTGAAIYTIVSLLLAMFVRGWTTCQMAVGESKIEAVLYGMILWGVLFLGMVWLLSPGMRTGFGAVVGAASGVYTTDEGRVDVDRVARDLKRAGADHATVEKYRGYYERLRENRTAAGDAGPELGANPDARQAARQAAWWSLAGVVISLAAVLDDALTEAGEVLQPVPVLGVRRRPSSRTT
jgi:hypothetical protein